MNRESDVQSALESIEAICTHAHTDQMTQRLLGQVEACVDRVIDLVTDLSAENERLKQEIVAVREEAARYRALSSNVKQFAEWHKSDYTSLSTPTKVLLNNVMWEKVLASLEDDTVPAPVLGLFAQGY